MKRKNLFRSSLALALSASMIFGAVPIMAEEADADILMVEEQDPAIAEEADSLTDTEEVPVEAAEVPAEDEAFALIEDAEFADPATSLKADEGDADAEDNDEDPIEATPMEVDKTYTATESNQYFSFTPEEGKTYYLVSEVSSGGSFPDPYVKIYNTDSYTTSIGSSDDDAEDDYNNFKYWIDPQTDDAPATYYFKLDVYTDDSSTWSYPFAVYDKETYRKNRDITGYEKSFINLYGSEDYSDIYLVGSTVPLAVSHSFDADGDWSDSDVDIEYTWYIGSYNEQQTDFIYNPIAGANSSSLVYEVLEGEHSVYCEATFSQNGHTASRKCWFYNITGFRDTATSRETANIMRDVSYTEENGQPYYGLTNDLFLPAKQTRYLRFTPSISGIYHPDTDPYSYRLSKANGQDITDRQYKKHVVEGSYEYDLTVIDLIAGQTYYMAVSNQEDYDRSVDVHINLIERKEHYHTFGGWSVTQNPTAVSEGSQVHTCTECDYSEAQPIAKLPAYITMNVKNGSSLPLKEKQSTTAVKVTALQTGDRIVSWTSSNKKVATVTASGKITGKKKGKATIVVRSAAGASYSFKVNVQKAAVAAKSISVAATKVTLKKGQSFNLKTSVAPLTTKDKISYTLSKKGIVTVKNGVIKAKKKGSVNITVKAGKKKKTVKVTVK